MAQRGGIIGVFIAAALALLLTGCSTSSQTFRYRMTVEAETPEALRIGSSVLEARISRTDGPWVVPEARGTRTRIRGEAVAVDLGGNRVLFALLQKADRAAYRARGYVRQVPRRERPMLVTFADLSDPTSVTEVDPDDLAATFGEGVTLKRITVQLTDDPVTTGIEKRLVWLGKLKDMDLVTDDFPEGMPLGNFSGLFSTESYKQAAS